MLGLKMHARLLGVGFNIGHGDLKDPADYLLRSGILAGGGSVGLKEGRKPPSHGGSFGC